jgi:hypothetical protein
MRIFLALSMVSICLAATEYVNILRPDIYSASHSIGGVVSIPK